MVLINDILDLSKIQANQMVLYPAQVNLRSQMEELHEVYKIEATKKCLALKFNGELVSKCFMLFADKVRLKQVIGNLLMNAIKFTPTGTIEFGVKEIGDYITFYIKDTGVGIPDSVGNSIFERFLKLENTKEKLFGGVGLGLAICKSLIEQWNGKIWYESEVGKGTTFYFTHPVSNEQASMAVPEITLSEVPDFKGKVVLIAEDEEYNYRLLQAYLVKTQASLVWAKNGREAINYLEHSHADIVLMDIKMPILGGIEATCLIKQKHPQLPIIAQTAFAYTEEIGSFIKAGMDGCISKPIKQAELMQVLKKYLRQTV